MLKSMFLQLQLHLLLRLKELENIRYSKETIPFLLYVGQRMEMSVLTPLRWRKKKLQQEHGM